MDFDQMLDVWRAQNTEQQSDVIRDALRQALQAEEARVRRELRAGRKTLWMLWIVGTGMAVWAGFWIAITISNGWPAIYAFAAGASLCMFALGVGAVWVSRGPRAEPQRNFGSGLQEEVRRNLALVNDQLSLTRRLIFLNLGTALIVVGVTLLSWTVNSSQNLPNSSAERWFLFAFVFVALILWGSYKGREEMRKAKPKLELRRERLRELLKTLEAGE